MKTASKRVRGLGSARGGTDDFWRQRLTAVINIPLVIGFVWLVACLAGGDHATVAAGLSRPLPAILMIAVVAGAAVVLRGSGAMPVTLRRLV